MNQTNNTIEGEYYSLCYDIPTPQTEEIRERLERQGASQELITAAVKREHELNRINTRLRHSSVRLGTRINLSVVIFTKDKIEQIESLIKDTMEDYEKIGKKAEIYILKYHGESGTLLKNQARNSLQNRLNKVLDAMDKLEEKLRSKKIQKITPGVKNQLNRKIEEVEEVAKAFNMHNDIKDLIAIAQARVDETE